METTKGRRPRGFLCVLLVVVVAGLVGPASSLAASKRHDPGTCQATTSATGDLMVSGGGFTANSNYQYEINWGSQASVGGGELTTDASGNLNADLGPAAFYMNVYAGETSLNFDVYPIVGNKAVMSTVAASCIYTPSV